MGRCLAFPPKVGRFILYHRLTPWLWGSFERVVCLGVLCAGSVDECGVCRRPRASARDPHGIPTSWGCGFNTQEGERTAHPAESQR